MSPSEIRSNSRPVEAQQDNLSVSTMMQDSLSEDIVHDSKKLKERITDLLKGDKEFSKMKQRDQVLVVGAASGLFAAMLPLLAAGATLAIPSAIVGLTLFYAVKVAVKAVQSGYKGLKYSAEKTVEGAKHIGRKIKGGYEHSADSLKRGAGFVSEKTKEKTSNALTATANRLYRAAGNENYSDKIDNELIPDSPQKKRIQEVKEDLRAICTDGKNSSTLIESILSGISEKIGGKKETYLDQRDHLPDQLVDKWIEQKKFIDNLDADGLRNLVTKRLSDKDKYFRDSIFFEHHDEIKKVVKECKEEHTRFNTLERLNKSAKRHKASPMNSLENSLSDSSSMSYISTISSKAELLNPNEHKEVKAPTSVWSKLLSSLKGGKKPEEDAYVRYLDSESDQIQSVEIEKSRFSVDPLKLSRSNSMDSLGTYGTATTSSSDIYHRDPDIGKSSFSADTLELSRSNSMGSLEIGKSRSYVDTLELSRGNSMGSLSTNSTAKTSSFDSYHRDPDSGFNSPSSSPQHVIFTGKNGKLKVQADLRKTDSLERLVGPSSIVTDEVDVEYRAPKMKI